MEKKPPPEPAPARRRIEITENHLENVGDGIVVHAPDHEILVGGNVLANVSGKAVSINGSEKKREPPTKSEPWHRRYWWGAAIVTIIAGLVLAALKKAFGWSA